MNARRALWRSAATTTFAVAVVASLLSWSPPAGAVPLTGSVVAMAATPDGYGYWLVTSDGSVYAFGDAHFFGSFPMAGGVAAVGGPTVGMAAGPGGRGYWVVGADDGAHAFGSARDLTPRTAANDEDRESVAAVAAAPDAKGYWQVTARGRVTAFGRARSVGSLEGDAGSPVVAMAGTGDGRGYWLVTSAGRVSAFGDARHLGSLPAGAGGPVVGMAAMPRGQGYWLATAGGGVFAFGAARFHGSAAAPTPLASPVVAIAASADGQGYWLAEADGAVLLYGDAPDEGSITALPPLGPARIAVYGDSQTAEASPALQLLAAQDGVSIRIRAFGGLAICDDLGAMASDAATWQPTAVIIDFSGNNFTQCMDGYPLGSPQYYAKYAADARAAIAVFRPEGARVVLVGAPIDQSPALTANVTALNEVYEAAAADQPGVLYVDAGAAVEQQGAFTETLPCLATEPCTGPNGTNVVRSPDGVHFCPTGVTHLEANAEVCDVYSSGALRFASAMLGPALAPATAVTALAPPSPSRVSPRRRR